MDKKEELITILNGLYNEKSTGDPYYNGIRYTLYKEYDTIYNSPEDIVNTGSILFGYIVRTYEDRDALKQFCIDNEIPITYPSLFKDKNVQMKWGINPNGVGLVGTQEFRHLDKQHLIFDNINDLKKAFEKVTGFYFK